MTIYRVILTVDNEINLHAFLQVYFKRLVLFPLKTRVIRNSPLNPYKTKQTLERLNFETLYFFKFSCVVELNKIYM